VTYEIGLLPSVLGKKYGSRFPKLRAAVAAMDAAALARRFKAGLSADVELDDGTITLLPEEVEVRTVPREGYAIAEESGILVGVDVRITPKLAQEGLARDVVRRIQTMRKDAGFDIADRITTTYQAGPKLAAAFDAFADYIAAETLSTRLVAGPPPEEAYTQSFTLDGEELIVGIER